MMLHHGQDHFIAFLHELFTKARYNQVDAFGRPPCENYFVGTAGIDELTHGST